MVTARFPVGSLQLCVERSSMRGVLAGAAVSPAPGAPPWLLGACNRGGRAVAVVDIALLTGMTAEACPARWVVVVDTAAGPVGLCAEGPVAELASDVPPLSGDVLVMMEPGTWFVDLSALPSAIEAALGV